MDALGLVNLRYDAVHGGFVDDLFKGLSDEYPDYYSRRAHT